ncbi:hypothetical protein SZ64_16155 [Erythrobacter sp. SG61-1L]|uniref:hypothetical protein n=1 Tax=Erythrobacter sp. SG61-1L TaxID=1603897 RepID=UPI0006C9295D|nr:hypothetical protein [Erythrobacter sp. SG61-1L]KPL69500.1 hypothetical protein SZ64_16155 [Erythrobacter sp. SG61-1L]
MFEAVLVALGGALIALTASGWMMARARRKALPERPRNRGGEIVLMIGMIFSSVLDPKAKVSADQIDDQKRNRKNESGRENE